MEQTIDMIDVYIRQIISHVCMRFRIEPFCPKQVFPDVSGY